MLATPLCPPRIIDRALSHATVLALLTVLILPAERAIIQSAGTPGGRAKVIPSSDLATAEKIAVDWAKSVGVTGEGSAALEQLRALALTTLLAGASGPETIAALSAGTTPPGMAMSIVDGRLLTEPVETVVAAGRQAKRWLAIRSHLPTK
jgi:hypothetical protein